MRILVWGSTPFAAYLTARLTPLHDVLWLTDAPTQQAVTAAGGVRINEDGVVGGLSLITGLEQGWHDPHLILLAAPGWFTSNAIYLLQTFLPYDQPPPPIVALSGGVGGWRRLESNLGAGRNLMAAITRPFWWGRYREGQPDRAHIFAGTTGGVALQADHPAALDAAAVMEESGLPVQFGFAESIGWSSVLWGIQGNALPAILNIAPGEALRHPEWRAHEIAQLREAVRVIDALNVPLMNLPGVPVRRLAAAIRRLPESALVPALVAFPKAPSFREDLRLGTGRSDAAYFNGAVAVHGHDLNLPTPINHALALTLTDLAEGRARWEEFQRRPELLGAVLRLARG